MLWCYSAELSWCAGHWVCHDGIYGCIPNTDVCNVVPDCRDKSDEDPVVCAEWNCTEGYWKCTDGLKFEDEKFVCYGYHRACTTDVADKSFSKCGNA